MAERSFISKAAWTSAVCRCDCISGFHLNFVAAGVLKLGVLERLGAHSLADKFRSSDVVLRTWCIPLTLHDIRNKDQQEVSINLGAHYRTN